MLTVNGQKMSKSLGNSFLPGELFAGNHPLLEQAYSPMTVRFFMLQSQYRSTLDFSNEALKASQKGYRRLINGLRIAKTLQFENGDAPTDEKKATEIRNALDGFTKAMNDDLNTAVAIAELFTLLKYVNMLQTGQLHSSALGETLFEELKGCFISYLQDLLGLVEEPPQGDEMLKGMLSLYREFKEAKKYDKVDEIRSYFKSQGLVIRDLKTRIDWAYDE
jgi:cysteinyl-tRNA synthetase